MKKYIFKYAFIIGLLIFLFLLKDNQPTFYLGEFNDYLETGIIDGFYGTYQVLLANTCFSIILGIATVTTTVPKDNKVKFKYLIAIAIILAIFFLLPFIKQTYMGGIANSSGVEYYSVFEYIMHIFK